MASKCGVLEWLRGRWARRTWRRWFQRAVGQLVLGRKLPAPPLYLGLLMADVGINTEPTAPSYARIFIPPDAWDDVAEGVVNRIKIRFPEATESWGLAQALALFDKRRAGTTVAVLPLAQPVEIAAGHCAQFAPGDVTLTIAD